MIYFSDLVPAEHVGPLISAKALGFCLHTPQVSLYDLRTLRLSKTLQIEGKGTQCVSLAFSHDSNLLLTQCGATEWNIILWNWAKARQLAKIQTSDSLPVHQVRLVEQLLVMNDLTVCG